MIKNIEWLNNEVEKRIKKIKTDEVSFVGSDFFDEGYIHGMKDVQAIANQLDEPEVLSDKWIDDNSVYASSDGITEEYVHVDELKELIVPKQEEQSAETDSVEEVSEIGEALTKNKPEKLNTGDPWIDNLPESYFEMYEEESKTDKYARHKEITDYMHKTYVSKNKDYGNSFERTHKEIGSRASLGRIADKFYRLQNIILNDEQLVEDETVKDTLIDMANYAIMFAMELEEEE